MAVEHAPRGRRGLYGSAPQMGVPAGLVLVTLAFLGMTKVTSPEQFASWGWRVPFLASALLVVVALGIRLRVEESPVFVAAEQRGEIRRHTPVLELLRHHKRTVAIAAGSFVATNGIGYLFMVYTLSYGTSRLQVPRGVMLTAVLVGAVVWFALIPVYAGLSDRIGRRRVYLIGSWSLLVWSLVYFPLLDTRTPVFIVLAVVGMANGLAAAHAPQSALFAELFPTCVRYSGASLAYQIGAILGGGLAPLVATALQGAAGASWPVTIYVAGICVLSLVCVLAFRETRTVELGTPVRAVAHG